MKLIILDRDGVINHESPDFVKNAQEWRALPGSLEAIARFSLAGWRVAVATNQSGLGRGLFTLHDLGAMHAKLQRQLATFCGRVDGLFFCPHAPDDGCDCRKPRTGLYTQISRYFGCALDGVPSVGDSLRDLEAARDAGATPILVRTGNGNETLASLPDDWNVMVCADLMAVADTLLGDDSRV